MLEQILQLIQSQGYCIMPEVIGQETLIELDEWIHSHSRAFSPARVGQGDKRAVHQHIRGDLTLWIDPLDHHQVFTPLMDFLDQLKTKLNECFYFGIKQFETHLAVYPPDAFYKKHKDRFEQDSSRVFTFIMYLNLDWKKEWGGELLLYNEDHQLLEEIIPSPGTLVCFLPEMFPHEVLPSTRERRSFTGWMHNKLIY